MEDLFAWLAILLLMAVGGWVLGIIGFFSARRALREIAELRRQIAAAPAVAGEPIVEPPGVSVPQHGTDSHHEYHWYYGKPGPAGQSGISRVVRKPGASRAGRAGRRRPPGHPA